MTQKRLYLNGEFLPIEQGRVSIEDRGFQFADGVYEVIRVYNGRPFALREHLDRLQRSLQGLQIPLPEPIPRLEQVCSTLCSDLQDATIYLQVTRGVAPRAHAFPKELRPTFVAYARELIPYPPDRTFTLLTIPDDRWGRCHLKTIALLPNVLGKQKAAQAGCDEGLFVREDGTVTEGTSSNAFMVKAGRIHTHPADNRILNGITREKVLKLARELGFPVVEQPFPLRDALTADEFFITSTTSEVMPVTAIDGKTFPPGPVTLKLKAAFQAMVQKECGPAAR